jgi:hypothetical protein
MVAHSRGAWFAALVSFSSVVTACGSDDSATSSSGGSASGGASGGKGSTSGGSATGGGVSSGGRNTGGTSGAAGSKGDGGKASGGGGAAGKGGAGQAGSTTGGQGGGVACEPITTFETGLSPTRVLHVATSGKASASGSERDPFDNIEAAVASAEPGSAIRVHAGEYAGGAYLEGVNGTATAPIWIGGAPGEDRPVIGRPQDTEAIHVSRARYLVLHDLVVADTTGNGLNLDDGGEYANAEALRYVVLRNLSLRDVGTGGNNDCLKLSGLNDFWILNSDFANCSAGGSNIDHVGCHDGLIAGNSFVGGGTAVQTKGGSRNIEIRGNTFRTVGGRAVNMGGSTGFEFFRPPLGAGDNWEARDIRVIANVFDRVAEALVLPGCVDCLIAHNTVYRPTTRILRILQETVSGGGYTFLPSGDGRVVNNLFFYTRAEIVNAGRAINIGAGTSPASYSFTSNLWYASDDVANSAPAASAYQGATVSETRAAADPAFTNAASGDFSLGSNSPAAAAGVDVAEAPVDFAGACYLTPPSLGAFERD